MSSPFAILPKETGASTSGASDEAELIYRPLTQAALNSIVIRAKREQVLEKGSPKTEITEYVQSEEVPEHNPVQGFLSSLPQWDGQNHIARIFGRIPGITSEQLNQDFMEKKDLGEMFVACFRQPHEGETVKTMNCGEIIGIMQKDYPTLQNTVGNKVRLGKTITALGFKHKDHSHVAYYEVVPLKAA